MQAANASAPRAHDPALVVGAMTITVLAWASAFVAIRGLGEDIRPGALTLGRLLVGMLCLGALQLRARWIRPTRREWLLMAGFGVGWFGIYNTALNAAEQRLDAGTAAMLVNTAPILIAFLAGKFLGERTSRWLILGALVSLLGVAIIAVASREVSHLDLAGVLLCLLAAVCYSVAVILQKVPLRRLPALQVTSIGCAAGLVTGLPFAGQLAADVASAPIQSVLGIVYLGVVPTGLAFTTWAYALARTGAGRLGVTTYLVPPTTILIAVFALGEAPHLLPIAGGAICLGGVALSRLR